MKQYFILLGILAIGFANAQHNPEYDGRIGINTNTPKASLDITRHTDIPAQSPQGLILPHLTTEQRNAFTQSKLTNGLMIYNTTKNCIDWWDGIQWACTDGTQVEVLPVNTSSELSVKTQVWDRTHYIASFNHNGFNADATLENSGKNLLNIEIPFTNSQPGRDKDDYSFNEINVVRRVKDRSGDTKTLTLHIPAGSVHGYLGMGTINATIKVGNGTTDTYKVKQLPANTEEEITNFTFSINGRVSTVRLIASGGILDRNWDTQTDGAYKHRFIYVPISVYPKSHNAISYYIPYEHTWLSNNLGAEYANANNPRNNFNPTQQAKTKDDYLAFGSLFQWQRPADGHELVEWISSTDGTIAEVTDIPVNNPDWIAGHSKIITGLTWNHISEGDAKLNLWQVNGANNPCPVGYHVPTSEETRDIIPILEHDGSDNPLNLIDSKMSYTKANVSTGDNWTSTGYYSNSDAFNFEGALTGITHRAAIKNIRCIKD